MIFYKKCAEKTCKKRVWQKSRQKNPHRYAGFFACVQIDQNGTGWTEAQLEKNLAVGTKFVVLSGGNGKLYSSAVYAVPGGDEPELILVGDVNGSGEVNGLDAAALAKYVATVGTIEDKYYNAADVNDNGEVNGLDAAALAKYIANVGDLCCQYTKDKTTTATPPTAE